MAEAKSSMIDYEDPDNKKAMMKYNGLICFKLSFPCPSEDCNKESLLWYHQPTPNKCGSLLYINQEGDMLCRNLIEGKIPKSNQDTHLFFVQNAKFECKKASNQHFSKFVSLKELSDFVFACGNLMKSISNVPGLDKKYQKSYMMTLQDKVESRWKD